MKMILLPVIALGVLLANAAPCHGQAIESMSPSEGAWGTRVTIVGEGFGTKRPTVQLTGFPSPKRKLKVLEHSADQIVVELRGMKEGSYSLRVKPKGAADSLVAPGIFSVRTAGLGDVSTPTAQVLDTVSVAAPFLGTRRGRVMVGGKKTKVIMWEPGAVDGEDTPVDTVTFRISKNTPNGEQAIEVSTAAGFDAVGTVTVAGGKPPKPVTSKPFLETFEKGKSAAYLPIETGKKIKGSAATWWLNDTYTHFPECGPTPVSAELLQVDGDQALRLTSNGGDEVCSANVSVSCALKGVALVPGTSISFESSGQLAGEHGDAEIAVLISDNRGNVVRYTLSHLSASVPGEASNLNELVLPAPPGGLYARDLFADFEAIDDFIAPGATVTFLLLSLGAEGWAEFDNVEIYSS